jgi:hypothetical protein
MLRRHREVYLNEPPMLGGIFVMNCPLECVADPARAEIRKLVHDAPQGPARPLVAGGAAEIRRHGGVVIQWTQGNELPGVSMRSKKRG